MTVQLIRSNKGDPAVRGWMQVHYSAPKGFVGRQLIYKVQCGGEFIGAIAAGSATRFLPGRNAFFSEEAPLNSIVNNIFYHVERPPCGYPCRNFTSRVVAGWRARVARDWEDTYGDRVIGFETLVELPRTGVLYLKDGWEEIGMTKGYTCKRVSGESTDSWTGRRVWDTENLRPKRVFARMVAP